MWPDSRVDLWVTLPFQPSVAALTVTNDRLTAEERRTRDRFVFERHRITYAVSHAFLRSVLSHYLDRDPLDIDLIRDSNGRPELRGREIRFNLSHSDGIAIVGVTGRDDIGVDVEHVDSNRDLHALAERVFTPDEVGTWSCDPASFFERWTLKEAYAKARGVGLAIDLQRFAFDLGGGAPSLQCAADFDDPGAWQLYTFTPADGYRAAAAVRCRPEAKVQWRVCAVDPLSPYRC